MPQPPTGRRLSRRSMLAGIGTGGVAASHFAARALADGAPAPGGGIAPDAPLTRYPTVNALQSAPAIKEGELAETLGFHRPGDGGGALYHIHKLGEERQPNGGDAIALPSGLAAVLLENEAVNYRMFGAVGDGEHDDGVHIKMAHEYANQHQIPVVNPSGEFWIKETNNIPIATNVHWGKTVLHIEERYNSRRNPRFVVLNDQPAQTVTLDEATKAALLEKLKPGVQIIPELAPYAGHMVVVRDEKDRIGIRAGANYSKRGWAREELFYVEEEGRIIGDIAWQFKDFTLVTATPCNDNYLVIEGGGLCFSGDTPDGESRGYFQMGIAIQRSRTIIREQWAGLEKGRRDTALNSRSGIYVLNGVYDVTLENIRAMPWEKDRPDKSKAVMDGTYGIGGARMLNCTFRNLTAEGGWVAWGVFGTNLNKNFRLENCRLNRVDVHFHCWNLYISNCTIGFKGISVTGGGDLFVENTTRHGGSFINFRPDYGARWDGRIRLRGCTLRPSGGQRVSVLSYRPSNFDYQYPIGFARSIVIDDLVIDYSAAHQSDSPCWLMEIAPFSKTDQGARLFFPQRIEFRNIAVEGREQGVRLIRIPDPRHYDLRRGGGCDESRLTPNCTLICDNVQLEKLAPERVEDAREAHLSIGGETALDFADSLALYPRVRFTDCDDVSVYLGNCIASVFFERCTVNTVTAPSLRGELVFNDCRLQPSVRQAPAGGFYQVGSTLGTRFTNCTIHAPIVNGKAAPEMVDRTGFLAINQSLEHYHLNTALGNEVLGYLESQGVRLSPQFVARLKSSHGTCEPAALGGERGHP